jgi:hypothetical protein
MRSKFASSVLVGLALVGMALPRVAIAHHGTETVELCGGRRVDLDLPWKRSERPDKEDCAFACHAVNCRRRGG